MIKTVILVPLVFIITLILLRFFYLTKVRGKSKQKAGLVISDDIQKAYAFTKKHYDIYQLRQVTFMVYCSLLSFEETVKSLKICKYFKYHHWVDPNKDILELHFSILGISNEYLEKLKELAILLTQLLQDFYVERLGNLEYPLVYVTYIQEGEVVFWVAKNKYGNLLIQERALADDWKDMPNMEELEDD